MEAERVRAQLQRILASSAFADADRGSRFLRFVAEAALEGRAGEIKEHVIGVGGARLRSLLRSENGPIVRVEAGRLRARLNSFYQTEGKRDAILRRARFARGTWNARHPAVLLFAGALLGFTVSALLLF
jgi:hypothetical protein